MLCNRIWQKQLLILKFEKGFFLNQIIFSWLQNMDQVNQCQVTTYVMLVVFYFLNAIKWKAKFEAVKINSKLDKVDKK